MEIKVKISRVVRMDSAQFNKGVLVGGVEALDREIHRQWDANVLEGWHTDLVEPKVSH